VTRAIKNVVDETKGHDAQTPKGAIVDAQQKNGPKRT
jgi:hypothetical protein